MKKNMLDIDSLTQAQQERLQKVLKLRDTVLSLRFSRSNIERWRQAAKDNKQSMTSWVENALNTLCGVED